MNHMYKRESKQEEKMNKLVSQIYNKDSNRDAQLMQVIREIQETKKNGRCLKRAKLLSII